MVPTADYTAETSIAHQLPGLNTCYSLHTRFAHPATRLAHLLSGLHTCYPPCTQVTRLAVYIHHSCYPTLTSNFIKKKSISYRACTPATRLLPGCQKNAFFGFLNEQFLRLSYLLSAIRLADLLPGLYDTPISKKKKFLYLII